MRPNSARVPVMKQILRLDFRLFGVTCSSPSPYPLPRGEGESRRAIEVRSLRGIEHVPFQECAGGGDAGNLAAEGLGDHGGWQTGAGPLDGEVFTLEGGPGKEGELEDETMAADGADVFL